MPSLRSLRTQYSSFQYDSYSWSLTPSGLEITFHFSIPPDHSFTPTLTIPEITTRQLDLLGKEQLNLLVFHLGLIEMLSYWKATCSPNIHITAGPLSDPQLKWWKTLIMNGMGEYFFVNQITSTHPEFLTLHAPSTPSDSLARVRRTQTEQKRTLIPVGGGKDSVVTLELLKTQKPAPVCLLMNPIPSALATARTSALDTIVISRKIDSRLLQLNSSGYLNGHTPFSAHLAFSSLLAAALLDFQFIALSNERSSNEGNIEYNGQMINHQYSKTFEFERAFQDYVRSYLLDSGVPESAQETVGSKQPEHATLPHYFSFLRPVYELQIAGLFSQHHQYHDVFRSCNQGQKTNSWCCNCPKCLFAYIMLFPYLGETRLKEIFGENLLEKGSLERTLLELVGEGTQKPFECVGTHEESLIACFLATEWYRRHAQPLPQLLQSVQTKILSKELDLTSRARDLLTDWNDLHRIPPEFASLLRKHLTTVPSLILR